MSRISLKNITKNYDNETKAVDDVSFEVNPGEFLVLVGPSGCGKSTILRMIAGLEDITSGELKFDETVMNNIPSGKRDVGMVFQNYALYPHMTVRENLAFPLKVKNENKKNIEDRVEEISTLVGLNDLLKRFPKQLSGGQRQRVALGRAIIRKPKVFLFDEPLSNLDAKLRTQMRNEIISLQRKVGVTSVYVTHDQTEAMTMGDRIVVLDNGKIQQVDTPENVYDNPANIFTASFIGSPQMNFFGSEELKDHLNFNSDVETIGIRPEDIVISNEGMDITVTNIESLGYETLIYFNYEDSIKVIRSDEYKNINIGDKIHIEFKKDKIKKFNSEGSKI